MSGQRLAWGAAALLVGSSALAQRADAPAGTSVGDTHEGYLVEGAELPLEGPGFHFHTNRGNPAARYGTPALVGAITRAAAEVAREHPGSDLEIHDLSFRTGGPIRGHGSHRSGRDADIAYYALGADGAPMSPTRSIWFAPPGIERHAPEASAARFDARRTWRFVRALLNDRAVRVSHVFMAPHLQRLLLRAAGRDAARLRAVVRTPRGRRVDPHADHLHVRIECTPADRRHGCRD